MKLLAASIIALALAIVTLAVVIVIAEGREHHTPQQGFVQTTNCSNPDPFDGGDCNTDPFTP